MKFSNFGVLEIYEFWYWLSKTFLYLLFTFSKLDLGLHRLRKAFVKPLFYLFFKRNLPQLFFISVAIPPFYMSHDEFFVS